MAGCYDIAGRQEIFSGNKKKTEEDQRAAGERVGDDQRAKHFLWPNPGQMTVKFIPHCGRKQGRYHSSTEHGRTHRELMSLCGTP